MLTDTDEGHAIVRAPRHGWRSNKSREQCQEVEKLADSLSESVQTASEAQGDLSEIILWSIRPTRDLIINCLEDPSTLLPPDGSLIEYLHTLTDNEYKKRWTSATRDYQDQDKVRRLKDRKQAYKAKLDMQDASLVSLICRLRNSKSVPPLAVMRGLENMFMSVPRRLWGRQSREGYAASETFIEGALLNIKAWRPMPQFPIYKHVSLLIEDNLEFYLRVPEERMVGGVLKKSMLLKTTTSKSCNPTPTLPQPYPDPTPTLPWPYPDPTPTLWTYRNPIATLPDPSATLLRPYLRPCMRIILLYTGRHGGADGCEEVSSPMRRHTRFVPCHVPLPGQDDIQDCRAQRRNDCRVPDGGLPGHADVDSRGAMWAVKATSS